MRKWVVLHSSDRGICCSAFLIAVFLICSFAGVMQAQGQNISLQGFITDEASGRPLEGANIILHKPDETEPYRGVAAGRNGFYSITGLADGQYIISISYLGYSAHTETLRLGDELNVILSVALEPDVEMLDGLMVTETVRREVGIQRIRPENIGRVPTPAGSGDLASYLQTQPGVVAAGDRGGQLFIRGGTPSENMVLIDGMLIYQPFHIIGFFSAFPEELISSADFYAGGFGARYSGRISSVLDVQMKDGHRSTTRGSASVSPFLAEVMAEGPIGDGRSSWIASFRKSILEETSPHFLREKQPLGFDSQYVKWTHFSDGNSRCSISGLRTHDEGRLDFEDDYNTQWSNVVVGGNCLILPDDNTYLLDFSSSISYMSNSSYDRGMDFSSSIMRVHTELNISRFLRNLRIDYGSYVHMKYYNYHMQELFHAYQDGSSNILGTGVYVDAQIPIGSRLSVRPGSAFSIYPGEVEPAFEPRLRLQWQPFGREQEQASAAMGFYRQTLTGISDRRDLASVFTAWMPPPFDGQPARAIHALAGWQQDLGGGFQWSVEGYYKHLRDIPVTTWSSIARFNTDLVPAGGRVYGGDVRLELQRRLVHIMAAYSYSKTRYETEQDHFGTWFGEPVQQYHPPHDRRHQINAVAGVDAGPYSFSARFQFGSGLPFTQPLGFDDIIYFEPFLPDVRDQLGTPRIILDKPLRGRLPDYHRLDVSAARVFHFGSVDMTISTGAVNTYNQANIFYYDIYTHRRVDQMQFIPYLSIKTEIL